MTTKFKKILITAVVAIPTAVISFLVIQFLLRDKSDIFQSLQKEAVYINNQTPLQLDEETTLDSAVAMNKNSFAQNAKLKKYFCNYCKAMVSTNQNA